MTRRERKKEVLRLVDEYENGLEMNPVGFHEVVPHYWRMNTWRRVLLRGVALPGLTVGVTFILLVIVYTVFVVLWVDERINPALWMYDLNNFVLEDLTVLPWAICFLLGLFAVFIAYFTTPREAEFCQENDLPMEYHWLPLSDRRAEKAMQEHLRELNERNRLINRLEFELQPLLQQLDKLWPLIERKLGLDYHIWKDPDEFWVSFGESPESENDWEQFMVEPGVYDAVAEKVLEMLERQKKREETRQKLEMELQNLKTTVQTNVQQRIDQELRVCKTSSED